MRIQKQIALTKTFFLSLLLSVNAWSKQKIELTGSSTVAPLILEIAKRFEEQNKNIQVNVQTGGSTRGVNDARKGVIDIGMVSRALKPTENDLMYYTVALDGISLILNKTNPVKKLTRDQVIDIYTGKIKNWKQVGGKDVAITVVNKAEGRSTLELFLSYFKLKNSEIKPHVVIGDNEQGIKTVSGNQNAIGYVSVGTAEYNEKLGVPIKLLPLDGVEASIENVKKGQFPLSRPLNLVTKVEPEGLVKKFIDFAQSKEVVDLVKEQYFVPLTQ